MPKVVQITIITFLCLFTEAGFCRTAGNADNVVATLSEHIDTITMTIGIHPLTTNSGLRSVLLHASKSLRIEPHAIGPNGQPISASANFSKDEALRVVRIVMDSCFRSSATKLYSERTAIGTNSPPPPKDAQNYTNRTTTSNRATSIATPSISMSFVIFDTHWYTYY